jgi:hypothetical protein
MFAQLDNPNIYVIYVEQYILMLLQVKINMKIPSFASVLCPFFKMNPITELLKYVFLRKLCFVKHNGHWTRTQELGVAASANCGIFRVYSLH